MFSEQLSSVYAKFQTLQEQIRKIKLEVTVYVTCDESFTEEHRSLLSNTTAPKTTSTARNKEIEHGTVEIRSRALGEKQGAKDIKDEVKEITTTSSRSSNEDTPACGPDGKCCCRTTISEASPSTAKPCCCSTPTNAGPSSSTRSSTSSTTQPHKPSFLMHPSIQVFNGRPQTKNIIRRSLEQALGESAVVVCGPHGLVSDVKQDVVELSDERAVHKGTGAQGVYLHTEGFGW